MTPVHALNRKEETIASPSISTAPKKAKSPLWKKLYVAFALLVFAGVAGDQIWKASGSAEWKLAKDEDGVKVYKLKVPGDRLIKTKTVMEGDYTLSQVAAPHIIDHNLETCKIWIPNCMAVTPIKDFDPVTRSSVDMWRLDFPSPFDDRELLISTIASQEKASKAVALDVVVLPNVLPHNEGVVRVEQMHNRWTFTPKPNGKVEVELIQDTNLGGSFPYFLMNMVIVDESHAFFRDELRKVLKQEKYANARFEFIDELR
jgi:hypothetical protein